MLPIYLNNKKKRVANDCKPSPSVCSKCPNKLASGNLSSGADASSRCYTSLIFDINFDIILQTKSG